jgi:hypothetical protein
VDAKAPANEPPILAGFRGGVPQPGKPLQRHVNFPAIGNEDLQDVATERNFNYYESKVFRENIHALSSKISQAPGQAQLLPPRST